VNGPRCAAQLEQIRTRLLAEAESSLAAAERCRVSKRQGERNNTGIYVDRGLTAINAVAVLDQVIYPVDPGLEGLESGGARAARDPCALGSARCRTRRL
jgi:hypothetical protein